jgi:rod shape-determining protein MreD
VSLYFGFPILLFAAVIQSTWLESIRLLGGRPDLVLLFAVTWGIIRGAQDGALWGFMGGIFCDLLSASPFGLWTFTLTLVGFLVGQPWVYALGPTLIRLVLMSALGTLVGHSVLLATMVLIGYPIDFWYGIQTIAGPAALINVLLSPFAFTFLVWFHKRSQVSTGGYAE